jgi:hypothetical protein
MSDADIIRTIKTQTLTLIQELTVNPKPSYSLDGQEISWTEYLAQLKRTLDWCDHQLAGEEPFEIHTTGYTP